MNEIYEILVSELGPEIVSRLTTFVTAPVENPDILPNVMPLILGAVIMELYFGKHKRESLGWNTAVGNAILWISTGISLYMTESLGEIQLYLVYGLIGLGFFVVYMDFFHKWPSTVAFVVSSSAMVYTLAYTLVIVVKTGLPMDILTYQSAAIFFVGINTLFFIVKAFETNTDSFGTDL